MIADPGKLTLIIVESPTKARTIKRYLPATCTVLASRGHVVDLAPSPKTGMYGVDVENGYELEYVIEPDKAKVLSELKKALKGVEQLVLATDEDREGESISWHLLNQLKPKCLVFRMVFHEITKQAITNAFSSCRELDMNLVHAQEARRAVDRLQGYGISPIISSKLAGHYSAGRVQSPGLKLVVEREKLRRAYKVSAYSSVEADLASDKGRLKAVLKTSGGKTIASSKSFNSDTGKLKSSHVALTQEEAEAIAAALKGQAAEVISVQSKETRQRPAVPFITSTLQQDGVRQLHKTTKEIMLIAQELYENGFITYMRTDSPTLSQECIKGARQQVEELFGKDSLSPSPRNYKATSQGAQEAHEGIRPAGAVFRTPEQTGLSGDKLKLYTLIWKRTLATQMKDALKCSTAIELKAGDSVLSSSGTVIKDPGFLKLYKASGEEEEDGQGSLPDLKEGDRLTVEDAQAKEHQTEPPKRFNEATLVKQLEDEGIGRPSTYATIISTLVDREYVSRQGNQLVPTFTGFFVDSFLENVFPLYIDYGFTSKMEEGLDRIASGVETKTAFLDGFWKGSDAFPGLAKDLQEARSSVKKSEVKSLSLFGLSYQVEHEGKPVKYEIKTGKFGPYLDSDLMVDGKTAKASIDQKKYFPGLFTDADASAMLFGASEAPEEFLPGIVIQNGRYGEYFKRLSDGKTVNVRKGKSASEYSAKLVTLLFELPKVLGKDSEGKEVVMQNGPYGIYASYNGANLRVSDPYSVTAEAVIEESLAKAAGKEPLMVFTDLEGEKLVLLSGPYGKYLKWGKKNVKLPDAEKADLTLLTQARAEELVKAAPEKKKGFVRRRKK